MRTTIFFFVIACAAGCNDRDSVVVVDVEAAPAVTGVASAHARAVAGGRSVEFDVNPGPGRNLSTPVNFGIDIPHAINGMFTVHVELRDKLGTSLGQGDGSGKIVVGGRADVKVTLVGTGGDMQPPDGGVVATGALKLDNALGDFGNVTINKRSLPKTFVVTNTGDAATGPLMLTTMAGNATTQSSEFVVTTDCGGALAPQSKCTVTAVFAPTSSSVKDAIFSIGDGTAMVGGEIKGMALTPGVLQIQPDSGSCGAVPIGTTSTMIAQFTVKNNGQTATANALAVDVPDNQFAVAGCGDVLAPGASCMVTVTFTAKVRGDWIRSLSVGDGPNDPTAATASVEGIAQSPPIVQTASPTPYAFKDTSRGATSSDTALFTFSNSGDLPTGSLSATVDDPTSFAVVSSANDCVNAVLAPTTSKATPSCTVAVQFKPTATGPHSAKLTVSDGSGALISLGLSGKANPGWTRECCSVDGLLYSVWAADAKHVWAVGKKQTQMTRNADGTWSGGPSSDSNAPDYLWTTGSGPTDTWVVDANSTLWHGNGTQAWGREGPVAGWGVFAFAANDVWWMETGAAASSVNAIQYVQNGENSEPGFPGCGYRIWGSSDNDLYCTYATASCGLGVCSWTTGVAHRGADKTWKDSLTLATGRPGFALANALWGTGPNDVYVAEPSQRPYHRDAGGWVLVDASAPTQVQGIWSSSPTDVYFVGAWGVVHGDGKTWEAPIDPAGLGLVANGVFGIGQTDVYVVGSDKTGMAIYHRY